MQRFEIDRHSGYPFERELSHGLLRPGYGMMGSWGGGGIFPFRDSSACCSRPRHRRGGVVRACDLGPRELTPPSERHAAGLDALDQRYARGEIDRDEYLQKRGDVVG